MISFVAESLINRVLLVQWKIGWITLDIIHTKQTLLLVKMIHRVFFHVQKEGCPSGVSEFARRVGECSKDSFLIKKNPKFLSLAV